MTLEGIHHITCITADAPRNVEFYVGVLGLRLVKKSVNQDDPTVYHLFYADERGSAGSDLTFFEYPGMPRGRPGAGMVHLIAFRVVSEEALDFWGERLRRHGVRTEMRPDSLRFSDFEGLAFELRVDQTRDEPLVARHAEIPPAYAIRGFDGARAYTRDVEQSRPFLEETMGFSPIGSRAFECRGKRRGATYVYDHSDEPGRQGAGTVHHVAWAAPLDEHEAWRDRVVAAGMQATPIIDRHYFKSIYFREPSGVLFEIASLGPGFTVDEPLDTLGEALSLPPRFEHLRAKLERRLTPLPDVRALRQGVTAPAPKR